MTVQLTDEQQQKANELVKTHGINHEAAVVAVLSGVENAGGIVAGATQKSDQQVQAEKAQQEVQQTQDLRKRYADAKTNGNVSEMISAKNALNKLGQTP